MLLLLLLLIVIIDVNSYINSYNSISGYNNIVRNKYNHYNHYNQHNNVNNDNSKTKTKTKTSLMMKQWWEDDLPNILGINPLEAAVIFGALYYFYGPTVLYEYAREAGRFVSTYSPIVRDVSLNIFNEFKEYFDEDQEREKLRKAGVDVSNVPRSTTNIIERFQEGLKLVTQSTDGSNNIDNSNTNDINSIDNSNTNDNDNDDSNTIIDINDKLTNDNKRRSKRRYTRLAILILIKLPGTLIIIIVIIIVIVIVIIIIIIIISPNKAIDQQFVESLAAVKEKISTITASNNDDDGYSSTSINTSTDTTTKNEGLSKFQQQLSGTISITITIIITTIIITAHDYPY
jgi:hypothetical protein